MKKSKNNKIDVNSFPQDSRVHVRKKYWELSSVESRLPVDLIITDPGDPIEGYFSQIWKIPNILPGAENREEFVREHIREDFRRAFLWVSKDVEVKFSDEIDKFVENVEE